MALRGIVTIVLDCVRADHVSAYGYFRATTPTTDALAAKGMLWERAYSTSSWTKPSVTSLLTGLYPTEHGAFEGIKRSKGRLTVTSDVLNSTCPTLAEVLTRHGWRCGAFINNAQLGEFSSLDRGFSSYVPMAGKADHIIALFQKWLEADVEKPFFAYLHFLEAHWPYKPRRRHIASFGGNRDTNYFRDFTARDYGKLRRAISRGQAELSDELLEQMVQMYDGAVRRLDGKIKTVLAMLGKLGLRDKTAIIITADHGEEFLEHRKIGHGQSLYDELTHVPLVAFIPGGRTGVRRSAIVSQVNLACTLLRLVGITPELPGRDLCEMSAFAESVFGELRAGRRYTQTIRRNHWKLHRSYKFKPDNGQPVQDINPRRLAAQCPHDMTYELYHMDEDPREQDNLIDDPSHQAVLRESLAALNSWWEQRSCPTDQNGGEVEIDDTVVQRLRDLGYID